MLRKIMKQLKYLSQDSSHRRHRHYHRHGSSSGRGYRFNRHGSSSSGRFKHNPLSGSKRYKRKGWGSSS